MIVDLEQNLFTNNTGYCPYELTREGANVLLQAALITEVASWFFLGCAFCGTAYNYLKGQVPVVNNQLLAMYFTGGALSARTLLSIAAVSIACISK